MPEVPEVRAHAERMHDRLTGRRLDRFQLLKFPVLKTFSPGPDEAQQARCTAVSHQGKYLVIEFDNGHHHIIHLMQAGRLRFDPKQSAKPRGGLARWCFEDDEAWLLTEAGTERRAGIWVVDGDPSVAEPLASLGPEARTLTADQLDTICDENSRRLHGLLRSQRNLAGIGRMLANEICFDAHISPFANARSLTAERRTQLLASIHSVIENATEHERTLDDIGTSASRPSKVHNRAGERCVRCDDEVRTVTYRAYTVYYCPTCQTDGKVLADNTTSRFLK